MPEPVPISWLGDGHAERPTSSADTRLQAAPTSAAHSSVVGKRLPPIPLVNGSGNDPTTAGIESVARQSCRSHQIRSP